VARKDAAFTEALQHSDVLLPDGISVVWAVKLLTELKLKKIAGEDLFYYEMNRLQALDRTAKVFFLGSTESVLCKIKERAGVEFPNVEVFTYSPPYKPEFSDEDNVGMLEAIYAVQPDVIFVGMTAPKQEKWAYRLVYGGKWKLDDDNSQLPSTCHVCCIGAVFDFYAGTVQRAPRWMIKLGLEWFYRLVKEPGRMWKRYLVGNISFVLSIVSEKINSYSQKYH
jgi:N-acetylglucosaminyldiphosphoundecaprenol N-acetyl-beta-D-mannosaminyltransferase